MWCHVVLPRQPPDNFPTMDQCNNMPHNSRIDVTVTQKLSSIPEKVRVLARRPLVILVAVTFAPRSTQLVAHVDTTCIVGLLTVECSHTVQLPFRFRLLELHSRHSARRAGLCWEPLTNFQAFFVGAQWLLSSVRTNLWSRWSGKHYTQESKLPNKHSPLRIEEQWNTIIMPRWMSRMTSSRKQPTVLLSL